MEIRVKLDDGAIMPARQTAGASGYDLHALLSEPVRLAPGARVLVPTGVSLEIPGGWEVQIRSRSGLAAKRGVIVLNSPATIDADYRGELGVILFNTDQREDFIVEPGARIAQIVFCCIGLPHLERVDELRSTARSMGGFGSTGT